MKAWAVALILAAHSVHASPPSDLNAKVWNHGAEDCRANRDPAIEVFRYDAATYILRQNKCVHFEAPFIYVLFGSHTVFVQDTGAVADPERSPLYQTVRDLISQRPAPAPPLRLLVTHSHSHGDHTAGDSQFRGKLDVALVEPDARSVREHFGFARWPEGIATIDLGGRELLVLPIPGHQAESIAVYDSHTRWLLTGDTLYPGELIVSDWEAYRSSIARLVEFSRTREVSAVMGTHIEMSRTPGRLFPRGNQFQPGEAGLALTANDLMSLDERLREAGATPKQLMMERLVVTPLGTLQRFLGGVLKSIGAR